MELAKRRAKNLKLEKKIATQANPKNWVAQTEITKQAAQYLNKILSAELNGKPKKLFPEFDKLQEHKVISEVTKLYESERNYFDSIKATIVMPVHNRADCISKAIKSIKNQKHKNFELLIVDDGSTDNLKEKLKELGEDSRILTFWESHKGVSSARNTALRHATGAYIFYLDSDNIWTDNFLSTMIVAFEVSGKECLYAASKLQDRNQNILGYRGEPFHWAQCLEGNYIDMNVFGHRAELIKKHSTFDTDLQRMVDWDLILRFTRENGAGYCPILGCIYLEDSEDTGRISTSKPYIYRKLVHTKNRLGLNTTFETLNNISLKFAIKIPAPYAVRNNWGDYHFAESLRTSLEALGHEVRLDFLADWDKHPANTTDVVLVLRGLTAYTPKPTEFSILWNISHPDQVSYEEYLRFDIVCVASASYSHLLSKIIDRKVHALLQCTDSKSFAYRGHVNKPATPGVFIGNSRNEFRQIVKWAFEADSKLEIYGQHWKQFIPESFIRKENLPNDELAEIYVNGKYVLNDHWASMRDFGIISNRVFDVVGCGGRLVSDCIPSIATTFCGVVEMVETPETLKRTISKSKPYISWAFRRDASSYVHSNHTFDTRAKEILGIIKSKLTAQPYELVNSTPLAQRRKRVGLIVQQGNKWPTSSAFIRLIAPLTTDYAATKLELIFLKGSSDPQIMNCDVCIVQRVAIKEVEEAQLLLGKLESLCIPLFIDTDDAFSLHEKHANDDVILRKLMHHAHEVWFSTEALAKYYDDLDISKRIIRNNLDPRLWRNYRKTVKTSFESQKVRFLYMGTATHEEDFLSVLPAFIRLDKEFPGTFELTLVGAVRERYSYSWLKTMPPPPEMGSYPRFVRWLTEHAKFDVGIAPLSKKPFNSAKSDIKVLDYAALGLLPMVTNCPPYSEAIKAGLAIGCNYDADDWFSKASQVIKNPKQFESIRARCLNYVWTERSTMNTKNQLVDYIANLFSETIERSS